MTNQERFSTLSSQKSIKSELPPIINTATCFLATARRYGIMLAAATMIACSQTDEASKEELVSQTDTFRDKILNQRIMLDEALKQLELEKKQVRVLESQIELNKEQLEQSKANQKMVEDYQNLQNALERRNRELQRKQKQYDEVNLKLDKVLAYLEENNIELITNELGDIEDVRVGEGGMGINAQYDSLMAVLEGERKDFDKTVKNLNRLVNAYQREAMRWKDKFNKRGLFISNLNSNFTVNFKVDSTSRKGALAFSAEILREAGKLKKGKVQVKITCSPPNGNLVDLYNQIIEYKRKDMVIPLENINEYTLEAEGLHQFVVYLGNEEVYYEDIQLSLP